nr:hypothetical protein [Mycoplasmopsis bovis]
MFLLFSLANANILTIVFGLPVYEYAHPKKTARVIAVSKILEIKSITNGILLWYITGSVLFLVLKLNKAYEMSVNKKITKANKTYTSFLTSIVW